MDPRVSCGTAAGQNLIVRITLAEGHPGAAFSAPGPLEPRQQKTHCCVR